MGKKLIILTCLFLNFLFAQEVDLGERKGLFQFTGSFYPNHKFPSKEYEIFLGGNINYFYTNSFSFRGDLWANRLTDDLFDTKEKHIQFTTLYHYNLKRFDFFTGFGIGINTAKELEFGNTSVSPITDFLLGTQFHFSSYFYVFTEGHFLFNGSANYAKWKTSLSYFGGLGIQLPTDKWLKTKASR